MTHHEVTRAYTWLNREGGMFVDLGDRRDSPVFVMFASPMAARFIANWERIDRRRREKRLKKMRKVGGRMRPKKKPGT